MLYTTVNSNADKTMSKWKRTKYLVEKSRSATAYTNRDADGNEHCRKPLLHEYKTHL